MAKVPTEHIFCPFCEVSLGMAHNIKSELATINVHFQTCQPETILKPVGDKFRKEGRLNTAYDTPPSESGSTSAEGAPSHYEP